MPWVCSFSPFGLILISGWVYRGPRGSAIQCDCRRAGGWDQWRFRRRGAASGTVFLIFATIARSSTEQYRHSCSDLDSDRTGFHHHRGRIYDRCPVACCDPDPCLHCWDLVRREIVFARTQSLFQTRRLVVACDHGYRSFLLVASTSRAWVLPSQNCHVAATIVR